MNSLKKYYKTKDISYFSVVRNDIIELINFAVDKVLDIGCGAGYTLLELKKRKKAKFVVGIDIVNLNQQSRLDKFILADIEKDEIDLPEKFFDVIILADILEHLKDPWSVLRKIKKWLNEKGVIVASIPNIREIKALTNIVIKGDFKYKDSGILDKTHLRFFCKKNIIDLFESSGYKVEKITYNLRGKRKLINTLTFNIFEQFLVVQYLVIAKPH